MCSIKLLLTLGEGLDASELHFLDYMTKPLTELISGMSLVPPSVGTEMI